MKAQNKAFVSVIMPAYNSEKYISAAIESVTKQTHENWELIVINDASPDNSAEIAQKYAEKDLRIRVINQKSNGGVSRARNLGIESAKGDFIAFLDSDDVWVSEKLEKQLKLLDENNAQIAYSSYDFIDENGKSIKKPFFVSKETDYKKMLGKNEFGCSTVLLKADLLKEHKFSTEFYHEDYLLWLTLLKLPVKALGVTDVLTHYRVVETSRSFDKKNAAKHRWEIYRKALKLSLFESTVAFLKYAVTAVKKHYFN